MCEQTQTQAQPQLEAQSQPLNDSSSTSTQIQIQTQIQNPNNTPTIVVSTVIFNAIVFSKWDLCFRVRQKKDFSVFEMGFGFFSLTLAI